MQYSSLGTRYNLSGGNCASDFWKRRIHHRYIIAVKSLLRQQSPDFIL